MKLTIKMVMDKVSVINYLIMLYTMQKLKSDSGLILHFLGSLTNEFNWSLGDCTTEMSKSCFRFPIQSRIEL